jgi:hypothetical protein
MNPMEDLRSNYFGNRHMYHGMQQLDMCSLYVEYTDVPYTVVPRSMAGMPVFPGDHNKNWHVWVEMIEHWKGTIYEREE